MLIIFFTVSKRVLRLYEYHYIGNTGNNEQLTQLQDYKDIMDLNNLESYF